MLDEMRIDDVDLTADDIRELENADQVAHFFAKLRYNVDIRRNIPVAVAPYIKDNLRPEIKNHELIAVDPEDEDIKVYLFEVRSLTANLRNSLARGFLGTTDEKVLLVLTHDYSDLEFVYIERDTARSGRRGTSLKPTARPIPLTVNRINPEPVKLRVLKRFTFSEEDSDYQWEKLRSAYMLAEWSEEYFNNRALFSDYYLKQRLTHMPIWEEDVRPVSREAYKLIISARKNFSRKSEKTIQQGLYEPMFALLGFDFSVNKASTSATDEPDYLLFTKGDRSKPIAVVLTYVWNRNLDDVDTTREPEDGTPDEIPGALVVSVLEKTKAPWVIVTNGKLWRLYSSTASNKATNYYEIDLEEAIAATDQITALKYWWLMFRASAFTGFLDTLLSESDKYAKELGERLKDDVFLKIFPQFAKGFIANMRAQGVKETEIDLDLVFSGTMTFLYRMMFILYAESLDLLPLNEERGYGEYSLHTLKRELARIGGENETDAPDLLRRHYTTKSTALYDRLKVLFQVIDKGAEDLNMPTYNGGLFSAENASGRFLEQYAIPDQFLILGLDRLTRDEDDKLKKLVFIDFKSLGVRQLGSIYEGLLEFKLKIAPEKLAVERDGKREIYVPLKKAKKKNALAAVEKGEVYLENDKQERKATGSYYTPDYIVKYIVQHTVGPVLERKLAECEPRLREAQKRYRQHRDTVKARKDTQSPELFWTIPEMQQLVDDCLNMRVLDPAMGSGHFLVEVVDFVSNKLITFLNGWSENPIWAALDRIRDDIMADMDRQRVTIDTDKLTRVALLKRTVLKRCVYGVDLNLMAVELAKVSLWLDAFTLGAPLSFLDHHLKWGNSLIGARIEEVQDYLRGPQGEQGETQTDMFSSSEFAGVMLATDLMRQVSYLSDNTVAQVQASQTAFRGANDHLARFKRLLDVYTSRWFDNKKIETTGTQESKKVKTDYVRVFLKEKTVQEWLKHPAQVQLSNALLPATTIAENSQKAAANKHFFHWELEFPEVFFAPSTPGGQDVKLREDGGFDAVVGNPPYANVEDLDPFSKFYLSERDAVFYNNKNDAIYHFIGRATELTGEHCYIGMIISRYLTEAHYAQTFRSFLRSSVTIETWSDFGNLELFEGVNTRCVIFRIKPGAPTNQHTIDYTYAGAWNKRHNLLFLSLMQGNHNESITRFSKRQLELAKIGTWAFTSEVETQMRQRIEDMSVRLGGESGLCKIGMGWNTGKDDVFTVSSVEKTQFGPEQIYVRPLIKNGDIKRFEMLDRHLYWIDTSTVNFQQSVKIRNYLEKRKAELESRYAVRQGHKNWYEYAVVNMPEVFLAPEKIVVPYKCPENRFMLDTNQSLSSQDVYAIKLHGDSLYSHHYLLTILNSSAMTYWYQKFYGRRKKAEFDYYSGLIENIPIRRINFTTPADERERRVKLTIAAYNQRDDAALMQSIHNALVIDHQTDVVHDVLAYLAQQMIDLNKQKQAEVKRFLGWLEGKLKITPKNDGSPGLDSLTGKTILQGYLGDYHRGQPETPWKDFYYRLHQNRNRFGVVLSSVEAEIEREYAASLAVLLPIKMQLARTDTLIDKIVYQLYGLTDAEIELIERPGSSRGWPMRKPVSLRRSRIKR